MTDSIPFMCRRDRPQVEPEFERRVPVDLDAIELEIGVLARKVDDFTDFAPPKHRPTDIEVAVRTIASFGGLPTKGIDDAIAKAKAELAEIEGLAQKVRDVYVLVTDDLLKRVEHLRAIQKIAAETFATLTERCEALDVAPAATDEPAQGEA